MNREPAATANSGNRAWRVVRIVLPVVVFAIGLSAWEIVVRIWAIPAYVLPAPSAVFATLIKDWSVLS